MTLVADEHGALRVGWGRAILEARGPIAIQILILAALLANTGALVYAGKEMVRAHLSLQQGITAEIQQTATTLGTQLDSRAYEHESLRDEQRILACILSLSPGARDELRQRDRVRWEMFCPAYMRGVAQRGREWP